MNDDGGWSKPTQYRGYPFLELAITVVSIAAILTITIPLTIWLHG